VDISRPRNLRPLFVISLCIFFCSERLLSGFQGGEGRKLEALYPLEAEFTRPAWIFGNSSFAFTQLSGVEAAYQIVCTYR
jgi:hypothetical protein